MGKFLGLLAVLGILMLIFIGGTAVAFIVIDNQEGGNSYPSQCYTDLQPSSNFPVSPSPISLNSVTGGVGIDSVKGKKIDFGQVVGTGSMRPTIGDKTIFLYITNLTESDLKLGDIVTLDGGNKQIIHRIIDISEDEEGIYYTTKGDNNPVPDKEKWRINQVKRKVIGLIF